MNAAKFDLTVEISDGPQGIRGFFEYNRDLFDRTTIVRLLGHLRALAEGAAARPESRLSELSLLSAAERHQLEREWNDTVDSRPAGALLHHLSVPGLHAGRQQCVRAAGGSRSAGRREACDRHA